MTEPHFTPEQREQMISWMTDRFVEVAGLEDAADYATQVFDGYSNDDLADHECDEETAHTLADTDMSYWTN